MRYYVLALLGWVAICGVLYLFGAFVAASFVITDWAPPGRACVALLGLVAAPVVGLLAEGPIRAQLRTEGLSDGTDAR